MEKVEDSKELEKIIEIKIQDLNEFQSCSCACGEKIGSGGGV